MWHLIISVHTVKLNILTCRARQKPKGLNQVKSQIRVGNSKNNSNEAINQIQERLASSLKMS